MDKLYFICFMPIVESTYKAPMWYRSGHLSTVIPSTFRKVDHVSYQRERIDTPDGDFLDLDWLRQESSSLVIITHGLEGSSQRPYVRGMAKFFHKNGWDALAWNCRGCSGEINRNARLYHHGATRDLKTVVDHAIATGQYEDIWLIGFSMGGSLSIKYLGEHGEDVPAQVKGGIAYSIPVKLRSSVDELSKPNHGFYVRRFLRKLGTKMKQKAEQYPEIVNVENYDRDVKTFRDFDNRYTAPLHGFKDAEDFYEKVSAGNFMINTARPILICNAINDPFLGKECYPYDICKAHPLVHLETPKHGGHVGFPLYSHDESYMEKRALEFIGEHA